MILTIDTPESSQYQIKDINGQAIPYVTYFDTETKEIEMCIKIGDELKEESKINPILLMQEVNEDDKITSAPILIKFVLPGAYATKNGERI
jgi:hypothetical protein